MDGESVVEAAEERGRDRAIDPAVDRPPASERPVPAGAARVAPFASGDEQVAALFALVGERLAAVVEPHAERFASLARRAAVYEQRVEASRAGSIALPLADAFDAWRLTSVDRSIVATLLAAACDPAIARLLREAGGSVEGTAAMIAPGHAGVLAVEERLAAGAPLARLALAEVGEPAGPPERARTVLARELWPAPRLAALARGAVELDPALAALAGARLQRRRDPFVESWTSPAAYDAIRAAIARAAPLPITWLAAVPGSGAGAIAADAALSLAFPALYLASSPGAGAAGAPDPRWVDAIAREALLHRAALVIEHTGRSLELLLHRLERLPLPVIVVDEIAGPRTALPVTRIELPPPGGASREALWRRSLGALDHDCDLAELAAAFRAGAETIDRAAGYAVIVAEAAGRPIGRADLVAGLRAQLPGELEPCARAMIGRAASLPAGALDHIVDFELLVRAQHAALALAIGPRGSGKTALAGVIALGLGLELVELDACAAPALLETAIRAAEQGLCLLGVDRVDEAPASLLRRLERVRGPVVAMARGPVGLASAIRFSLRPMEDGR